MKRTIRVIQRSADGWNMNIVQIAVNWFCPVCGKPRGEPVLKNFCEDGDWYSVDCWSNPCGHVDMYRDVLKEATA